MFRSAGFVLAGFAVWMVAACSGDAEGGEETGSGSAQGGSGGSASTSTGAGGSGSSTTPGAGSGGSSGNGGSTGGARYTAREACELFTQASCEKGLECGLVLQEFLGQVVCVQCSPAVLQIGVDRCLAYSAADKDKAAVDRCVAGIDAQQCAEACVDPNVDECAMLGELDLGNNAIVCDQRCAE